MSILTRNRRRTVARDLTIGLVLTISVVIIGFSLANYYLAINQAEAVLTDRAKSTADNLAQVLAAPLWNIDTNTVEQIVAAYQQIDDLIALKIFDESNQITYQYPQDDTADQSDVITERRPIVFEGNTLGSVEIVFTKQALSEQLNTLLQNLGIALAVILTVVAVTQLLLRRLLTQPITQLAQGLDIIAKGDYKYQLPSVEQADINVIAQRANDMAGQISERDNQLRGLVDTLEQRVDERTQDLKRRTDQLEAITQVSRIISTIQDLEELLPRITRVIGQQFDFYHAGIFLLDESREFAVLRAANSEGGQAMLERNHRLEVGQTGIVGYVTSTGNPRIARDIGEDAVYYENPDMPETRSEMALPLKAGDQVIGALDVQSTEPNAFTVEDIDILSTLAELVSTSIQNVRLYEESREALSQAETAYRQMAGQAWSNIRRFAPLIGYRFDGNKPVPLTQPTNGLQSESQEDAFSVPVQLRGETIGRLRINPTSEGHQWSEDEIAIIRATAERVALAAENARLVLESQKRASKEQVIGEISTKIGAAINLENILQTTLREIGRILPGAEISIQVENE